MEQKSRQCTRTSTISNSIKLACNETWSWDLKHRSHEVRFYTPTRLTAFFHPNWSNGTAGVMGEKAINSPPLSKVYWEVQVSDRLFGTSMMFGIATRNCRVHAESFVNLIGEDCNGWGLSHKGILWHDNCWVKYTKPFKENTATTIGMLYDGQQGTLTYFKDGENLGVAFKGLDDVPEKLYPMICSTAAKTQMTLQNTCRDFFNLQDMCRHVIHRKLKNPQVDVNQLELPKFLQMYISSNGSMDSDSDDADSDCDDDDDDDIMLPLAPIKRHSSLIDVQLETFQEATVPKHQSPGHGAAIPRTLFPRFH